MFTSIHGNTINELAVNTFNTVLMGRRQESRNGDITCVNNVVLNLTDPRSRHLNLVGRKSNIFAQIAETMWVMSGDDRVNPLLSFFLPRAKDFSDDGETWRGAYGPRLYLHNQLQEAVEVFKTDGITTRQSVIQILLPELDSKVSISKFKTGDESGKTKDRPCNNELVFFCTPYTESKEVDGVWVEEEYWKLNMNVFQRSGDCIWGCLNINSWEWTFLQELMAANVAKETGLRVELGEYTHFVTNLHIYDFTKQQAVDVINTQQPQLYSVNDKKVTCTGVVDTDKQFFTEICTTFSNGITSVDEVNLFETMIDEIDATFTKYGVVVVDNLMYDYCKVVAAYIASRKGQEVSLELEMNDFTVAVADSAFRKFKMSMVC